MKRDERQSVISSRRAKIYGIWFICIGIGFCLLGVRSWAAGDFAWRIALRFLISAGFLAGALGFLRQARGH